MDLEAALMLEHSKANTRRIADYIGDDKQRFADLMHLFFLNTYRLTQRAAAVVNESIDRHPQLINPWMERMIDNLYQPNLHDAVKRNTVRALQFVEIPEVLRGRAADICFQLLGSAEEPIAVKAFSMGVLYNITVHHPELKNELQLMIEDLLPYGSAGIKSRGKRILRQLEKL